VAKRKLAFGFGASFNLFYDGWRSLQASSAQKSQRKNKKDKSHTTDNPFMIYKLFGVFCNRNVTALLILFS